MKVARNSSYVLISACRNESQYVGGLVDAIAAQTVPPTAWFIIDDGSTDDTFAKASARCGDLPFLKVIRMPGGKPRSFTSQVYAALHGYNLAKTIDFESIGFLDADIRVPTDYYEQQLAYLASNPRLGLCGGAVIDQYEDHTTNIRKGSEDYHVAGGVQFFRRECFEQIGGYTPIQGGGQDTIADILSQMHGWEIHVIPHLVALHLRPDGFDKEGAYQRGKKWGRKFYLLGYHPLYFFAHCIRRIGQRPMFVASAFLLWGFLSATMTQEKRPVSDEFVHFIRQLQMKRIRRTILMRRLS